MLFSTTNAASEARKTFRPERLADIVGQAEPVRILATFVANPYPNAFIFAGPTGTGKTSAAHALAKDLGVAIEQGEFGGLFEISSGDNDASSVKAWGDRMHLTALYGSGWRVLIVNEADSMTAGAEIKWLDVLENLPRGVVVVFTTNNPSSMSRRFRDRCDTIEFTGDAKILAPHIATVVAKAWAANGLAGDAPTLNPAEFSFDGEISFRRIVQHIERIGRGMAQTPRITTTPAEPVPMAQATGDAYRMMIDRLSKSR